jgi:hypothetical protein
MSGFTSLGKKNSGGVSGDGSLNANAVGPFGTALVSNLVPMAQGAFVYGINDILWKKITNGGAIIQSENGVATCTSNTEASRALLSFNRGCKYRPGQGVMARFTSAFSAGQSGSLQLAGVGNDECGYFFAMSGSTLGILHRERSKCEIRSFTVNATVAGETTITITLGGFSKIVTITGGSNANQTAYQISLEDYSSVGRGFHAEAHGDTVQFISCVPGVLSPGEWSIKNGSVSIVSIESIIQSGSEPSDDWIPQTSWNIDTLDGSGPSRFDLNPLKGNVYGIGYQYLGFGNPVFSIENPETGFLTQCHMIQRAGTETSTVLKNPSTTVRWEVQNSEPIPAPITLSGASAGIFNEGIVARNIGVSFSYAHSKTGLTSTEVPVMSIRANKTFKGQSCFGELAPFNISIGSDTGNSSSGKLMRVQLWKNLSLSGPTNFTHIDSDKSIASYDVSSTGYSSNSRTQLLKSMFVAANDSVVLKLEDENFFIANGDILTITAKSLSNSNIDIAATSVSWFEDQ